ncbi:ABC transporter substrate-binding protein [Paenibacillus sp. M2]|uniref:ABC transporter substrate-binding protein n=1 Tax=Paenibacillus sp. M2 TaxID=3341793 RepID=UPI003989E034
MALLWLTDSIQARLSENHVRAKNEAASRLQEYLSGIREIKAHNMGGQRFERLRRSFDKLKSASIGLEGIMGPTIALPYSYYDWRDHLTFLADTFGEESKKDEYLAKYDAKSAEWKQKLEAAVHGESFAVIETYPNNLVIYSDKGAAEMLYGEWGLKRTEGIPDPEGWGGKQIALEALATVNPDRLLLMENSENKMVDSKVWNDMNAVKNEKIYKMSLWTAWVR